MHQGEIISDLESLLLQVFYLQLFVVFFRIPGMIGYLVAGVVVGPYFLSWVHAKEVMTLVNWVWSF